MTPSVLQMDGKGGDLGKRPRITRAAAIIQNDEKTGQGVEAVEAVEAVWSGFSFHLNGQISQSYCAWNWG